MNARHHFDPESIPVQTAQIDDIHIAYKDFGTGDPFILINGFGSTMDMWNPPVLEALSSKNRVVIFDNRGIGYSGSSEKPYSISLFAGDTQKLMEALNIARAHILGFSMGGMIAQELALGHSELVQTLIILSSDCGGSQAVKMHPDVWEVVTDKSGSIVEQAERMFSVLFPPIWLHDHDPWEYCTEVYETTPEENIARQAETLALWEGTFHRLPGIQAPTLVVTGTDDVIIPAENASILVRRIPSAWLVQFRNGGHGLTYQFPVEFSKVVMTFLEVNSPLI
ncbi:MAG TPA: alpha/beta hydrolase [Methanoregulaceae archaeon]|nr:alpha/beta hydrolase [Methanoregulaceae archaeon]